MTKQTKKTDEVVIDSIIEEMTKLPTTSSKIRFLDSKNKTRSEIVKILNEHLPKPIRYQHVRNVLITPIKTEKK